jgi:RHS repeat-associated protein
MKKNFSKNIVVALLLGCSVVQANGQNVPVSSTLSSTANASSITLPLPYNGGANASYSNASLTTPKLNYSRTWVPHIPVTDIQQGFTLSGTNDYSAATEYMNGWGQPIQTNKRGGFVCKDIVIVNDLRPSLTQTSFLPFNQNKNSKFFIDGFIRQKTHYDNAYPLEQSTSYTQSKIDVSQSVPESSGFAPGRAMIGHAVGGTATVVPNVASEIPKLYVSGGSLTSSGFYAANELVVKQSVGQHDAKTKQYYDKNQKLICSKSYAGIDGSNNPIWLTTYNVYDKFGRLIAVVPPRVADNYGLGYTQGQCFTYEYDDRGQVISKHTPGQIGNNFVVYDRKHRAVLQRTPNMDAQNKWEFVIYDKTGREVLTGLLSDNHNQAYWQNLINTTTSPTSGSLLDYLINEFSGTYPSTFTSITDCQIQTMNYYDDYSNSFFSGCSFNTNYTSYYKSGPGIIAPEVNNFTFGLLTGTKTAVLNSTTLNAAINTRYYYDKKGQVIQVQTQNPWNTASNYDVSTFQYNFSGQKVLDIFKHFAPNGSSNTKPNTLLQTAYNYSLAQDSRLTSVEQKIDNSQWRNVSSYFYDDFGRVREKMLGGVEVQDYDYDMRGQLSGINSVYSQYGPLNVTNKTFGCRLMRDFGFSVPRYDGRLAGYYWRGSGNMPERAYGYKYDPLGRVIHAEFRENSVSTYISGYDGNNDPIYNSGVNWNKQTTDYTVSNLAYDKGGNILSMNQVGNPTTLTNPTYIDVLGYFYNAANRLTNVRDAIAVDYHLDDFLDKSCSGVPAYVPDNPVGLPGGGVGGGQSQQMPGMADYFTLANPPATPGTAETCADYTYDLNGNLTFDNNKGISEITYNQFDLPVNIDVDNPALNTEGTINHVYAANGALLQKTITDVTNSHMDVYTYWGPFVYRNDSLLYILHQEGRSRYLKTVDSFRYDYFVKDHQGNVRTVITADLAGGTEYMGSHELASANLESSVFFQINKVRGINPSPTLDDVKSATLDGAIDSLRIGTAILLHVLPGDQLELSAKSYWEEDTAQTTYTVANNMLDALICTLTEGTGGYSGNEGPDGRLLNSLLNSSSYVDVYDQIKEGLTDPSLPRAYLNYMTFDNSMQLITDKSSAVQVNATSGSWQHIGPGSPLLVEQEGYVLVYISNEQHKKVHFDDVDVVFYRGRLIQEQHYYPYGLSIKEGEGTEEPNKFKFEGNSKLDELGLQLYDFHARQYDPQIGRFWSIDPLAASQTSFNPYHFCEGDPANRTDPTGLRSDMTAFYAMWAAMAAADLAGDIASGQAPSYMLRGGGPSLDGTGMTSGSRSFGGGSCPASKSGSLKIPGVAGDYTTSGIEGFGNAAATMATGSYVKFLTSGSGTNPTVYDPVSNSYVFQEEAVVRDIWKWNATSASDGGDYSNINAPIELGSSKTVQHSNSYNRYGSSIWLPHLTIDEFTGYVNQKGNPMLGHSETIHNLSLREIGGYFGPIQGGLSTDGGLYLGGSLFGVGGTLGISVIGGISLTGSYTDDNGVVSGTTFSAHPGLAPVLIVLPLLAL